MKISLHNTCKLQYKSKITKFQNNKQKWRHHRMPRQIMNKNVEPPVKICNIWSISYNLILRNKRGGGEW